nr:adhesive plaque matrix protein-like [Syngnathus scovelli]
MGPGLTARFSWICLLLISNAASVPVQQKYSLRPPLKSNSVPPEDLRPSLTQQTYAHGFLKGQSAEPTSGSWSQSSPATSDAHLAAYAGNSNQHSSAPAHADSQFAKPALSGSRWPLSAQTSEVIFSNAGHQASMAMAQPLAEHPGIQHYHSWESYTPVHEQPSGSKPSAHQVKGESLEGRQMAYPGSNLPPSWAEYLSEYEPLSGHEAPAVPVVLPGGEKGTPSHTAKGQPASVVGGGLPQNWALYEPTSSFESPTASESPVSRKGDNMAHSGGHRQSWAVGDVQPFGYRPAAGLVKVDTVKGKLSLTPSESLPPTWPLFNPVYEPPSNYELPTAPENSAGKGHHVFPGGKKGWSASSPFDQQRPIHEPSPGQVDTVKWQQVRNAGGQLPPSWAIYTQVFSPSAAPEIPPKVSPGTGKDQEYSRFDVEPPSYKPGKLPPTWAQVYSSPAAPEIPPKVSPGTGKDQEYSRFDVEPPSYKPGKLPPTWAQVYSPAAPEIPPKGVKLRPITGKRQLVSPPGGHVQQSWSAYSPFEQNPVYEPLNAEVDSGHGQQVWHEGGHLPPTWAQGYSPPAVPEFPTKVSPGGYVQQSWSAYSPFEEHPSYEPSTTEVDSGHGPQVWHEGGHLLPSWAQVYSPEVPTEVSPSTPYWSNSSPFEEEHPIYEPSPAEVDSVQRRQVWNVGGDLPPSWAIYKQVFYPPATSKIPSKVSPGTGKGQLAPHLGSNLQRWSAYSPLDVQHPSYEHSPAEVDTVHGQQVWNEGGHLPPTWAQGFSPPTAPEVSPGIGEGQKASHQRWAASSQVEHAPRYKPSPALHSTTGSGKKSQPSWSKVGSPPGKGQLAEGQSGNWHSGHMTPATGGVQVETAQKQPRWAATSPLKFHGPSSYKPSSGATLNQHLEANPGGSPLKKVQVGPPFGMGQPASGPAGRWPAYSSASRWSPSFNPSVVLGGAASGEVTSELGRKPASAGVLSAHVPDHASSYKPSRLPTDSGVKGQPAHPDSNWHLAGHRLFPHVDPDHHGASQLEGSDPAASVSTWNVHQSSSSDPSKGSGHLSVIPGAPWVFDEFPDVDDDEPQEQHNEVDDAAGDMEIEGKMEVPTYIVRNRNGYEQERKELSQMHYTQRVAYPYVPSQRRLTKIL